MRASEKMPLSWVEGTPTMLHSCLASEVGPGGIYSQTGVHKDEKAQLGGWPMDLPNPEATPGVAARLCARHESAKLVGL